MFSLFALSALDQRVARAPKTRPLRRLSDGSENRPSPWLQALASTPYTVSGIIHGAREVCGWSAERARQAVDDIAVTAREVIALAAAAGSSTAAAALRLATARLAAARQPS